ncbi:MAG: hypothetical protein V4706_01705 [Pseudomonadota bacterium]
MKQEEVWQWRTLWLGKMTKTRYKCTEEFIRPGHPEAVRVEGTMEMRWLPEHPGEYCGTGIKWGPPPAKIQASADPARRMDAAAKPPAGPGGVVAEAPADGDG